MAYEMNNEEWNRTYEDMRKQRDEAQTTIEEQARRIEELDVAYDLCKGEREELEWQQKKFLDLFFEMKEEVGRAAARAHCDTFAAKAGFLPESEWPTDARIAQYVPVTPDQKTGGCAGQPASGGHRVAAAEADDCEARPSEVPVPISKKSEEGT